MLTRHMGQIVATREDAYVFIDGGYVREVVRKTLKREDIVGDVQQYAKFLSSLLSRLFSTTPLAYYRLVRVLYYDAIVQVEDDPEEHKRQKEFFSALERLIPQFEVKLGTLVKAGKGYRQKGVDTLLAIDMITKAFMNRYQIAVLMAEDRDFVSVVKAVREFTGKLVCGVYDSRSIADELLRAFDLRRPLVEYDFEMILKEVVEERELK